jgi:hypothetical protein
VDRFGFNGTKEYFYNPFEGQIIYNMMQALLKNAYSENILILNQQTVTAYQERQCCRNCW